MASIAKLDYRPSPAHAGRSFHVALVCCLALALVLGVLIPWAEAHHHTTSLVAAVGIVAVVGVLATIPIGTLPVIALLVSLLIPAEASFLPKLLEGAALGVVPLLVWIIRSRRGPRPPAYLRVLALAFGVWVALSLIFASFHTNRGLEWFFVVEVTLVLVVMRLPHGVDVKKLRTVFLAVTTVVAVYAIFEGFLLHSDPLFGRLFEHTLWWARRRFDTSYRITTLFGQPLDNGLVFSAAAVLAASEVLERRERSLLSLLRLALLAGAVVATHERGPAVGLAVGMVAVIVFTRVGHRDGVRNAGARRLLLLMGAAVAAVVLLSALQTRNNSTQGKTSASIRAAVITRTKEALRGVGPFGVGPGEVDSRLVAKGLTTYKGPTVGPATTTNVTLEDSYAEIVVNLGILGAVLGVSLLLAIVVTGFRTPLLVGETAALLTLLIDIGGYNAIQGQRSVLVLVSLFTVAILTGADSVKRGRAAANAAGSRGGDIGSPRDACLERGMHSVAPMIGAAADGATAARWRYV